MEDQIKALAKTLEELKRDLTFVKDEQKKQGVELEKIGKDLGIQDTKNISEVIYKIDNYLEKDVEEFRSILRDVQEIRRTVTSMEVLIKEVMRGMSVIYSSVDELEENILPERLTK